MMRSKLRLRETLGLVCLFLMIVTLSITTVISFRPLYLFNIQRLNTLKDVKAGRVILIKSYDHLMMYLNNPFEKILVFPDPPMSDSVAFYFYGAKKLSLLCYGVLPAMLLPSVLYLKHLAKNQRLWALTRPFQWEMFLFMFSGFSMLIGFDQFFTVFRRLFFNSDAWLFNPLTDPIINVLPEAYSIHHFILFFVSLEGLFLIGILIGKRSLKK